MTDIIDFCDRAKFMGKRISKIQLSDLKTGTPVILEVYDGETSVAEVWGKIRWNGPKETSIDIFCYKGQNINFNAPQYHIVARAFQNGVHEIAWENKSVGKANDKATLIEQRDNFRIYIGEPAECLAGGKETAVLLVDLSEGGFRVMSRDDFSVGTKLILNVETDDGEVIKLNGNVVWGKKVTPERGVYGCQMDSAQDPEVVKKYLNMRQEILRAEFEASIRENE